jgi:secondary thiamine-phosphate synthase enzyme
VRQRQETIPVTTRGRGFTDLTVALRRFVGDSGVRTGLAVVHCPHTSCSLLVQENADPAVLRDLERWLSRLAPEGADYEHDDEGPDDMPAHLRAACLRTSETIPVTDGRPALGRWQALWLVEHRSRPHERRVVFHVVGEGDAAE